VAWVGAWDTLCCVFHETLNRSLINKVPFGSSGACWDMVQLRADMYTQNQTNMQISVWGPASRSSAFESKPKGNEWLE